MNRTLRDSRNVALRHRRELSFNSKDSSGDDINLDDLFFSESRRSVSLASLDESDAPLSAKLGRLSIGSVKQGKSGLEDLISSVDGGKNDYDWLLSPPGTPSVPPSDENDNQRLMARRNGPAAGRSTSTTKASRLCVSQSEVTRPTKPTRSSSVTRPSVSSSYSNKPTSILNTSSASVSSYIRPSTPTRRSPSTTRPSTPPSRPTLSRSTTPSKPRPARASTSSADKPRPSTPTSRPKISTSSRPSTPTRRNSAPSLSPANGPATPGGRTISNGRVCASLSRPSSPGPRVRPALPQPVVLPDFPLEKPPNLRTSLPDRPISAGRSRPGSAATVKGKSENITTNGRRQSSPSVAKGRISEPNGRSRTPVRAQTSEAGDSRREMLVRRPSAAKSSSSSSESNGFGRTISKKSLDMAIRHMDIRNGGNGAQRPLTGSNLFPHSIRSNSSNLQKSQRSATPAAAAAYAENIDRTNRFSESGSEEEKSQSLAKVANIDVYESSRYDMILLKEDLKNANWLRSLDVIAASSILMNSRILRGKVCLIKPTDAAREHRYC